MAIPTDTEEQYPIPDSLKYKTHLDKEAYLSLYERSLKDKKRFWHEQASQFLSWDTSFSEVYRASFSAPDVHIQWFSDGRLNVSANCLDRHLPHHGDSPALIWEPDDPHEMGRVLTYKDLHQEVCRTANLLKSLGVKVGDRVTIYLPMVPEAAVAMLACARIGAIHSVVFAGFSDHALHERIVDCGSECVITADEGIRGGKHVPLKAHTDKACQGTQVRTVLVLKRTGSSIAWNSERDVWWHERIQDMATECAYESFPAEQPLFILYTSGSTGKPKGLLHTSGGYLLHTAMSFYYAFDYNFGEVFWCTADVGWVTGHSYGVYGPLAMGATTLMFEGVPTWPDPSRCWQIVDKYKVSSFYTAPTAVRMLEREGDAYVKKTDRTSLRILGSVGEPINPEAWRWYYAVVGDERCAVVDTWWQTETGGFMILPFPGATEMKPGSASWPFFGIRPVILTQGGEEARPGEQGALCIAESWPGQARSIWGDHKRFVETYFSTYPGYYYSGDGASQDADGYFWVRGRMDDVLKVSGHRLGTAEIEAAINQHSSIVESAVVGFPHPIKGEGIYAYVITLPGTVEDDTLRNAVRQTVRDIIGSVAAPEKIQFVSAMPKTRSGKIMRRILRKIAEGSLQTAKDLSTLGDISTLLDPDVVIQIMKDRL
jgi:acetyl-CoA synthetase